MNNSTCNCNDVYLNAIIQLSSSQFVVLLVLILEGALFVLNIFQTICLRRLERGNGLLAGLFMKRNGI